jgi:sulfite reductase beta subunit-like hemoprotein
MPREEMTDNNMRRLCQIAEKFETATGRNAAGVRNLFQFRWVVMVDHGRETLAECETLDELEAKIDEAIAAHGA